MLLRLVTVVVCLAWSLWFGGLVALLLFVQTLFRTNRALAVEAAPLLFRVFERAQLIFAAICVLGTFVWFFASRRRSAIALFVLLGLGTIAASVQTAVVTRKMEALRWSGQSGTGEFRKLHGMSMLLYTTEAGLLLVAGIVFSGAAGIPKPRPQRAVNIQDTGPGTARA